MKQSAPFLIAALLLAGVSSLILHPSSLFAQGSLTPPGAPAPLFKTLQQVEPRTPISSLPFVISNSGSFYVVSNLNGIAVSNGITITASDVTLDLGGFVLAGLTNSGDGIQVSGARTNLAIRNGSVRGWGGDGINALGAINGQYQELRLSDNQGWGLNCGANSTVINCTAHLNGTGISGVKGGFSAGRACTVVNCIARDHYFGAGTRGFATGEASLVNGCTADNNQIGIVTADGSAVVSCIARSSVLVGISVGVSCTVKDCTASANTGDGISVDSSCRVVDNACAGNGGAGIVANNSRNRIDSNTVMGNATGIKCNPASANLIVRNSAKGNTSVNYDLAAGNNSGAIILSPGVGFSSSNPWANFEF
ncbi:MAG: right-handed parallel beta-helix repeat-containing protein [Verrucomicrobia bacterium]|nr:right-handed parallel beta-helix repeat-containing protein [Verrucomicrobiota bacterium]